MQLVESHLRTNEALLLVMQSALSEKKKKCLQWLFISYFLFLSFLSFLFLFFLLEERRDRTPCVMCSVAATRVCGTWNVRGRVRVIACKPRRVFQSFTQISLSHAHTFKFTSHAAEKNTHLAWPYCDQAEIHQTLLGEGSYVNRFFLLKGAQQQFFQCSHKMVSIDSPDSREHASQTQRSKPPGIHN